MTEPKRSVEFTPRVGVADFSPQWIGPLPFAVVTATVQCQKQKERNDAEQ